jgi:hypothetical protein
MAAHGHIIQGVLVKTNVFFPRELGSVMNVWLAISHQLQQELSVVQEDPKFLALIWAGGSS